MGVAAGSEVWLGLAKGLLGFEEEVEKGFDAIELDLLVENGFPEEDLVEGLVPKRLSPILRGGFAGCNSVVAFVSVFLPLSFGATVGTLTPRNTRTLPSFRLQVFRRHVRIYSRRSWPSNSGSSPFNCSSRTIRSLHTLHLARAAEGGENGSSHV